MKRKTAALYDPYLDTLGGGEKHILSILQVLAEEGYETDIFWKKDLTEPIKQKFLFKFINKSRFIPNIFINHQLIISSLKTLQTLKTFNFFFYVTNGSYFFSSAKKNYVFCMVPQKNLYQMNLINRLKTINYRFISNSQYTKSWLEKWGIQNEYIYPYIDDELIKIDPNIKKEKIILSVGRFFAHLHVKQHEKIIEVFNKIQRSRNFIKDFKLILAGGLRDEDVNYFKRLQEIVKNNSSIQLLPNISYKELINLYKKSMIYWHFTGFMINEDKHPESVEHLGITPLEAMAAGCLTFCYNAGGPKEIIDDGVNGFLFSNDDELIIKMHDLLADKNKQSRIKQNASKYIKENFSYPVFKSHVKKLILND